MRVSQAVVAARVAVAALVAIPVMRDAIAEDGDTVTFECVDENHHHQSVTIDLARKIVRSQWQTGAWSCEETVRDGVVGPTSTPRKCNIPFVGEAYSKAISRQVVEIDGNSVTYGGVLISSPLPDMGGQREHYNRLNVSTGAMTFFDGTAGECRRVPRPRRAS